MMPSRTCSTARGAAYGSDGFLLAQVHHLQVVRPRCVHEAGHRGPMLPLQCRCGGTAMTAVRYDMVQIRALIREVEGSRCFAAGRNSSVNKRCYRPKHHKGKHNYYV